MSKPEDDDLSNGFPITPEGVFLPLTVCNRLLLDLSHQNEEHLRAIAHLFAALISAADRDDLLTLKYLPLRDLH